MCPFADILLFITLVFALPTSLALHSSRLHPGNLPPTNDAPLSHLFTGPPTHPRQILLRRVTTSLLADKSREPIEKRHFDPGHYLSIIGTVFAAWFIVTSLVGAPIILYLYLRGVRRRGSCDNKLRIERVLR
ncbi:unnamed protein product [Periconia digitata]|uniref:Uncharacterized protein n=1 Tax=Periconia digitata TaxID=1303443 RepID=A0A9W4XIQ7_9PLEO|nr:unnamed protein product [Periconia digitata]